MSEKLTAIPTNIITGFLGVGKTTAILNLLKQKPANERWAVLVNEFGEVGIDGSLLKGLETDKQEVFIREVPGGCMCCAAGLPMQVALNSLLAYAKPHRLLIEPTGLGHPKEVISVLSAEHYQKVLDLCHTITLVDARKISDKRYTEHDCFIQQLQIADKIIANKADLYAQDDFENLQRFVQKTPELVNKPIYQVSHSKLLPEWLEGQAKKSTYHYHAHESSSFNALPLPGDDDFPKCGYLRVENQGEGFVSFGWVFNAEFVFDQEQLYSLLTEVSVERLKAVFITSEGIVGYNKVDDVLTKVMLEKITESRIELITVDFKSLNDFEKMLLNSVINSSN